MKTGLRFSPFIVGTAFFPTFLTGQDLLPAINADTLPDDAAVICSTPPFSGSFETNGFDVGDTVPQFTLFGTDGSEFDMLDELQNEKPVLLIAGSYTCPVFRGKVPVINDIVSLYDGLIRTVIVYTVEAHPTDPSPYTGEINITEANISEGILFPQPANYGDRKAIADTMLSTMSIMAPVYLDSPCNEWWLNFGPAPNNAYLVDTNGIVFAKHGWFHQYPHDIYCDIDSILGIPTGCASGAPLGTFSLNVLDSTVYGSPGEVLYTHAELINSGPDDAEVLVKKILEVAPADWEISFCINGTCYLPSDDSVVVLVPADDTVTFSADFFTDETNNTGSLKTGFKNLNVPTNQVAFTFLAITGGAGIPEQWPNKFSVYPNPSESGTFTFKFSEPIENGQIEVMDCSGRSVYQKNWVTPEQTIYLDPSLPEGLYLYQLIEDGKVVYREKLVVNSNGS